MEDICQCKAELNCCQGGTCIQGVSCGFCQNLKTNTPVPTTGLGLSPPNPIRLAKRLEKFFGGKHFETPCSCRCNGSTSESCCCLACPGNCSQACSDSCRKSSCPQASGPCPRKTFCEAIQNVKVTAQTSLMRCCDSGNQCHCQLGSSKCSGQCCSEPNKQSLKCMIRRLVSYFKSLQYTSSPSKDNFKNCCELMCVLKTCDFLQLFYDRRNLNECSKCKSGGSGCSSSGGCCNGDFSNCVKDPDCCKDCPDCGAVKFSKALETLRFAGPCGHDLWRTLDAFIQYCCFVFYARVRDLKLENKIKEARDSCDNCKSGSKSSGHSDCSGCKSGTSCDGCTAVLEELRDNHKDVLSLMTRGYLSAYSEASWNSLTPSTPGSGKCCGSLSSCSSCLSCSSTSPCDPSKCCPDCPQRKAAKIFLGMLPCLYYGLKILKEKCEVDWKDFLISNKDYSPGRFLIGMGFELQKLDGTKQGSDIFGPLSSLINGSNGPLEKLYDFVSKKYFPSPSLVPSSTSSDSKPETVREILLWLSGLPFSKGFKALLKHCERLCKPVENSLKFNDFKSYLFDSCFLSPFVLGAIEGSKSNEKDFPPYKSEWQKFSYPSDTLELFEKFCDFVRKIYIALNFLCIQCKNDSGQGGWQNCWYGKNCKVEPLSSGSASGSSSTPCCSTSAPNGYLCTALGSNKDVHDEHCREGQCINANGGSCSNSNHNKVGGQGQPCVSCSHPLQAFLTADPSCPFRLPFSFAQLDFSQSPPVILPSSSDKDFLTMGFKSESLISPGRSGESLFGILNSFCGSSSSPLTKLFEFSLFVAMRPPETLIELYAFLLSLGSI
ncbi:variant erythrocyte surface antigen-1 family protein [Babesia divergens]|uniref:Variant erythrocyte surface antigen-1 family protein n=1 Tax=Babesia divergens TaxID=32595 RepID=A0AAD9G4T9_BABDI|nr:variant erythrocyte surface antigen-1 family protein [Babesia divergens]